MPRNWMAASVLLSLGCAAVPVGPDRKLSVVGPDAKQVESTLPVASNPLIDSTSSVDTNPAEADETVVQTGLEEAVEPPLEAPAAETVPSRESATLMPPAPEGLPAAPLANPMPLKNELLLDDVIGSVYSSYPLLESAFYGRNIAAGEQLAATGNFDLKLKAATDNGPTGYYRTFRQNIGLIQPLYNGSEVFAGYRIGRGSFEPWYKERQTNDGGEFKAGVVVPLAQNRDIDSRRGELWRSNYGRQLVEQEIHAQLIGFVQEASYVYWDWVAAGEKYRIAQRLLSLAEDRNDRIRRQVEEGFLDPPELTDNQRLVAERLGKIADSERKLRQTGVKLSLFYRDIAGARVVPDLALLPRFPAVESFDEELLGADIHFALAQRPEIGVLNFVQRQLEVDYAEARNQFRPEIDAVLAGSQDVGYPTSPKNDKGQFELDASIFVDVPLQRRKAQGKMQAVEGKISQLNAKRRLLNDKIVSEVEAAYLGLQFALEQVRQARRAVEFAEMVAQQERRSFEQGASDLLKVTLREQYAFESAEKEVDSLLLYFQARADYRAALAQDQLPGPPDSRHGHK